MEGIYQKNTRKNTGGDGTKMPHPLVQNRCIRKKLLNDKIVIFLYYNCKFYFDLEDIERIRRDRNNDDYTNIPEALDKAVATFSNSGRGNNIPKMLIVVTDGVSNVGRPTSLQLSAERARYSIFVVVFTRSFLRILNSIDILGQSTHTTTF